MVGRSTASRAWSACSTAPHPSTRTSAGAWTTACLAPTALRPSKTRSGFTQCASTSCGLTQGNCPTPAPTSKTTPAPTTAAPTTAAPTATAAPTTSSPTYGYNEALKQHFGLRAGTKDGVLEIVAGGYRVAVPLGAGSDWHHYCLTYDGPSRGGKGNLTLYFDGQAAWQRSRVALDTGDANALRFGADAAGAATLAGAVDEIYAYSTALTAPHRAPRRHHLAADGRAELGAHRAAEPGAVAAAEPGAVVATVARADNFACADDARVRVRPRGLLPDDARQAGRRPHVGIPRQGMEARST